MLLLAAAAASLAPAAPRTDAAAVGLLRWARGPPAVATARGFTLGTFDGGLEGVLATEAVPAGTKLVSLPRRSSIHLRAAAPAPSGFGLDDAQWRAVPWISRLALLLLRERTLGKASAFAPYVESLPAKFDTPRHWSDDELARLQDGRFARALVARRAKLEAAHAAALPAAAALGVCAELQTAEAFGWAADCVCSRAFRVETPPLPPAAFAAWVVVSLSGVCAAAATEHELALYAAAAASSAVLAWQAWWNASGQGATYMLAPVLDAMNHRSATAGRAAPALEFSPLADAFEVTAAADLAAGEQIFISYGEGKDNDALLEFYGFVEPGNPHDRAPAAAAAEAALCAMAGGGCGSTLEEDEALLARGGLGVRRALAVQWRAERKRVLRNALS